MKAEKFYNEAAEWYDNYYSDPVSLFENKALQEILGQFLDNDPCVIDIGCGTGLFLELFGHIPMDYPMGYVGIDPSIGMLKRHREKFPTKLTYELRYEDFKHFKPSRVAIGLFASPGYVSPRYLDPTEYKDHFLMFYREGFRPGYYDQNRPETKAYKMADYNLSKSNLYWFSNFDIATSFDLKPHSILQSYKVNTYSIHKENPMGRTYPKNVSMDEYQEFIAAVAYEATRAYCQSMSDFSQVPYEEAPQWIKDSFVSGVKFYMDNPETGPDAAHEAWRRYQEAKGWEYGEIEDKNEKKHPCLVHFEDLPVERRAKDYIFKGIIQAFVTMNLKK